MRLTDAEREHAASLLHRAHNEGRITLDELDRRLGSVYAAHVVGDLEPVLSDVPSAADRRRLTDPVLELDAGMTGISRSGRWEVPRRMRVQQHVNAAEEIRLDYTAAEIGYLAVELELRLGIYGRATIVVPPLATADLIGLQGPGKLRRTDVPTTRGVSGVHFVITGRAPRRSAVSVRYARPSRWWHP